MMIRLLRRLIIFILSMQTIPVWAGDPTEDVFRALMDRENPEGQAAALSHALKQPGIKWSFLKSMAHQVVELNDSEIHHVGFMEAILMANRFDGIAELIDAGVNPLDDLPIEFIGRPSRKLQSRLFHRLIEQLLNPEDFSTEEMKDLTHAILASLKYRPVLNETLHRKADGHRLIDLIYKAIIDQNLHEGSGLRPNQLATLKELFENILKEKLWKPDALVRLPVLQPDGTVVSEEYNMLLLATHHQEHRLMKNLVDAGANVEVELSESNPVTPLSAAIVNQDRQAIELLVSAGANINRRALGRLNPRPLHAIPSMRWLNNRVPDFVAMTKYLMSFGLDPMLGSGHDHHDLDGEVQWRQRLEKQSGELNPAKILAWDHFLNWLRSADFVSEYAKHVQIRKLNREAFPNEAKPDRSAYAKALEPILSKVWASEFKCPDPLGDIGRRN
jgi:hypothetical protein